VFSIANIIEFVLIPYQIAFNFALLKYWFWIETLLDGISCLDFLMHFFIEQEVRIQEKKFGRSTDRYYNDNKKIAMAYLK